MANVNAAVRAKLASADGIDPERIVRRVIRRLVPFLVLVFAMNMLVLVNIGFAALQMNQALGLTATNLGVASSCYWVSSVLVTVPSTLALSRFGARRTISSFLIAWGILTGATGFAQGATSLYVCRFLLGFAAGAGFSAILLYLTYWIPESYRARVNSWFFISLPVTNALALPLSALIMHNMHGIFGLAGWRWMYAVEGFPSIFIGIVAFYYMTDRPKDAKWLAESERGWLQETIDKSLPVTRQHQGVLGGFSNPVCYVFGMGWFGIAFFMSAITTFLPLVIRQMGYRNIYHISLISAIPFVVGLVAMLAWGNHSDKKRERLWHAVIGALVGGAGWVSAYFMHSPVMVIASVTIATAGLYGAQTTFWALPPLVFSKQQMAMALGLINAIGQLGGLSPIIFGRIRDVTGSYSSAYLTVAAAMMITGVASILGTYWGRARKVGAAATAAASAGSKT